MLGTDQTQPNADSLTLPLRQWGLDNFGEDLLALPKQGRLYVWDESGGTGNKAVVVTASPSSSNFMFVSQQDRHVVCLGTNGINGTFDPMLVRWSDQMITQIGVLMLVAHLERINLVMVVKLLLV